MCRSIKVLRRPDEPATEEEVQQAARQFVRKISGFNKPSRANQEAFDRAIAEITAASERLLHAVTHDRTSVKKTAVAATGSQPEASAGVEF